MKKVITALFSVSCILTVCSTQLKAQENAFAVSASNVNITSTNTTNSVSAPYGVSTKVYNDFTKRFDNATDVNWSTKDNHTFAYFKENGIPVRVTYNKKEKLEYTTRYYSGAQVSEKITNLMRRNGYDMNIIHVTEIKRRYATTTFVKMEDETSYLTIKVHPNGEFSVFENYLKAD